MQLRGKYSQAHHISARAPPPANNPCRYRMPHAIKWNSRAQTLRQTFNIARHLLSFIAPLGLRAMLSTQFDVIPSHACGRVRPLMPPIPARRAALFVTLVTNFDAASAARVQLRRTVPDAPEASCHIASQARAQFPGKGTRAHHMMNGHNQAARGGDSSMNQTQTQPHKAEAYRRVKKS